MNILHIPDFGAPYKGNFIASLDALRFNIESNGGNFYLILPERVKRSKWFDNYYSKFGDKIGIISKGSLLSETIFIKRFMKEKSIDVVHTHFSYFDISAWLAAKLSGAKVIWHCHSDWGIDKSILRTIKNLAKHRLLGLSAYGIAVSESVADTLIKKQYYKRKLFTIQNGISDERYREALENPQEFDVSQSRSNGLFTFLMFAWAPKIKGLDIALDACAHLHKNIQNKFQLIIIGRKETERFISEYKSDLPVGVIKVVGPVQNPFNLYLKADCFCSFSRSEGFSYSLYEAMLAKVVVLVSKIEAMKKLENTEVFFFESENAVDAAKQMEKIIKLSQKESDRIGESNSNFVKNKCSIDLWVEKIVGLYSKILK